MSPAINYERIASAVHESQIFRQKLRDCTQRPAGRDLSLKSRLALLRRTSVVGGVSNAILEGLPIKIYADGAAPEGIITLYQNPFIKGFTTNPTLLRQAGISDYEAFARSILAVVTEKPISFEVFSDEFPEMRRQALKIRDWQENVYVKIPVTNTRAESSVDLIRDLTAEGVKVNVTAVMTEGQVDAVAAALNRNLPAVISVFAGRIADTGVDPTPVIKEALNLIADLPQTELLWASVREVLNIFQAALCHCHIVTVPHAILAKAINLSGIALEELSVDTVQMFYRDAATAGFQL